MEIIKRADSPNKKILLLITGLKRLDDDEHDRLIKKILNEFPYDYSITNIEKPYYKKLKKPNSGIVQIYKLWDTLKEVPENYSHIIKVRNDIEMWDLGLTSRMIHFVKFWLKGDFTVGMGPLSAAKLCKNFRQNETVFMGDYIIFFRKTSMINPYTVREKIERKKSIHDAWTLCFDNKVFHYNMPINLVRKKI